MPRPRTPTPILELRGAFDKNPNRRRPSEPKPEPLGDPPDHLHDQARQAWVEIVSVSPAGVLGSMDRPLLEIASNLLAAHRNNPSETKGLSILISCLSKLGMSPTDRSKVVVVEDEKPNKWAYI